MGDTSAPCVRKGRYSRDQSGPEVNKATLGGDELPVIGYMQVKRPLILRLC